MISFDNDDAGMQSMVKLLKSNASFKYFKWFEASTPQKDINEFVLANGDPNVFEDPKVVESMVVDKLMMKMQLIQSGKWTRS